MNKQRHLDTHSSSNEYQELSQRNENSAVDHRISSHLLRWSKNDLFGDLKTILRYNSQTEYLDTRVTGSNLSGCKGEYVSTEGHVHKSGNNEGVNNDKKNEKNITKFDIIIAADCLFFTDFHIDFIWILKHSLVPEGIVYMYIFICSYLYI
jgi:hypothetical protein